MVGHDLRVNLLVSYGRQLVRSLLLLAHYVTVVVTLVSHSISLMLAFVRWMVVLSHHTTSAFNTLYRYLHWWNRGGGVPMEICSGSDTESD